MVLYRYGTDQKEQTTEEVGINWHIAVHRYEIKTNNGSAVNTHIPDIENVIALPDGKYEEDETVNYFTESAVEGTTPYLLVMDMSGMMDGNIGYALDGQINRVLCDAVTRTETGGMPPCCMEQPARCWQSNIPMVIGLQSRLRKLTEEAMAQEAA